MDNVKFINKNKGKILVGLFALIIYVSVFIFFLNFYYSEKDSVSKTISLPDDYIYIIDNDDTSKVKYEKAILDNFPSSIVSSYAISSDYFAGNVVKIIGIDEYVMDTGIFINNILYSIDKKELKEKEVIVSSLMTPLVDDSINFNETDFSIVGSFLCDEYIILMDIETFVSYIEDIKITIGDIERYAYQYHLVKLNHKATKGDLTPIYHLYGFSSELEAFENIFTKEIYVSDKLADKGLSEELINLLFWLSILFNVFSIINWARIYYQKRRKDFAIRRVYGATKNKIRLLVLANTVSFGLICSILGIVVGFGLYLLCLLITKKTFVLIPFSYYFIIILVIVVFMSLVGQVLFGFENKYLIKAIRRR